MGSSQTNPLYANYQPGRSLTTAEMVARSGSGAAPMSSPTNQYAANYHPATSGSVLGLTTGGTTTTRSVSAPATTTNTDTGGAPSVDYNAELMDAINNYYTPAMDALNQRASEYGTQLPVTQSKVNDMYNSALTPINERQTQGETLIGTQRTDTTNAKVSAISQARQLYNELLQQGLSKFGGASSAGGAYAAIIGKQIAKNMGGIEQTNAQGNQKLDTELKNLSDFTSNQKIDLESKRTTALEQVQADYDNNIKEINAQKDTLEADKAAQRITALKEARDRAYAVQDAATSYQRQLDLFNQQTQATLASKYTVNGGISADAIATFTKLISAGVPAINAATMSGIDPSMVQGIISPSQIIKDAYGNPIDPSTGQIIQGAQRYGVTADPATINASLPQG